MSTRRLFGFAAPGATLHPADDKLVSSECQLESKTRIARVYIYSEPITPNLCPILHRKPHASSRMGAVNISMVEAMLINPSQILFPATWPNPCTLLSL